ncbi:MAG: hypothetical protein DMF73_19745 [Acidobacteria bacterium]|nr:MAG: hypothetical protein DMF73_19745 [Acidobacteriota bacterium]
METVESINSEKPRFAGFAARWAEILNSVIFWGLMVVIVVTLIPYGTVDAWWQALFECAVFALTAVWLCETLLRGEWQVKRLSILLPLVLITAYAFIQTINWPPPWFGNHGVVPRTLTIDRYQTYLTARKTLSLTLFLGLLLVHTSTPKRLHWLVRLVVGLGLTSALFALLRQALQSPDSTIGFGLPFLFYGVGYGQFISPNVFAYLMEMVFGLMAGLILGGGIRRNTVLISLTVALIVWTALVLSNSRGGVLGFACQNIFLISVSLTWYSARRFSDNESASPAWLSFIQTSKLVRVLVVVLIVGTLFVGVLWLGGDRLATKLYEQDSGDVTIDGTTRKEIWQSTWTLIKHHPWTGVGFGAYFLAIPEYQIGSGRLKVEQAHNDYLDLVANGGIIAVILAAWFFGLIIWRARSSLRSVCTVSSTSLCKSLV